MFDWIQTLAAKCTRQINPIMSGKTFLHLHFRPVKIPLQLGRQGIGHGLSAGFQGAKMKIHMGIGIGLEKLLGRGDVLVALYVSS